MKALMITPSYFPIKGGVETIVHDISKRLNEKGICTDILTLNISRKWNPSWHGKFERDDDINIYRVPALNWFPLTHSNRITMGVNVIPGRFRKMLKGYDILHFHGGDDLTFPFFSLRIKKPKIFHLHGLSLNFYKKNFVSRLILKNIAHTYICPTTSMKKELRVLGISEEKIEVLPNGVDVNLFYPLGEREENLVLFIGRVCREKGIITLLKALTYLKIPINLVIIGPQDSSPKHFNSILELIEREKERGKHKITYLGEKKREELIEWYRKASLLALPSQRECFPMVILEALACGTPVIATNVGGIPEILSSNECGILIPPNNPWKLAEAIQFLLDNKDIRMKFGQNGRRIVKDHFSIDTIIERLRKIYNKIISKFGY